MVHGWNGVGWCCLLVFDVNFLWSGWLSLLFILPLTAVGVFSFRGGREMNSAYIRVEPGRVCGGGGGEHTMRRAVSAGGHSYVGASSLGLLAAAFKPQEIVVRRTDLLPSTGYRLPSFRCWNGG